MRKKLFGLLLVVCLVVGLLPVVASAATPADADLKFGFTTLKLTGYDKPVYTMNYSKEVQDTSGAKFTKWGQTTKGATEENYNAKYEWKTGEEAPTLTLRGFKMDEWNNETEKMEAKYDTGAEAYTETGLQTYSITTSKKVPLTIILTGEDSLIECKFGITYYNDLTIKSEGDTKLTMYNYSSCISPNGATSKLTINANLDLSLGAYYNTAFAAGVIQSAGGDIVIDGGTIDCKIRQEEAKTPIGISARNGGNLIINGGNITAMSIVGQGPTNGAIKADGKMTINGGVVNANPKRAVGLYATLGIEINGGEVNVMSPYYGINVGTKEEPAEITMNGGTLKVIAERAVYGGVPIKLGTNIQTSFAGANEKSAEPYDGSDTKVLQRPWVLISSEKIEVETAPTETEPAPYVPTEPTGGATTPSSPAASTPNASTPNASTPNASTPATNDGNNSSASFDTDIILWIVIGVAVAAAVIVVVVVLVKRKKA